MCKFSAPPYSEDTLPLCIATPYRSCSRGCSGDYQISVSDNPFQRKPKPQQVFVNLTTPHDITGPTHAYIPLS